MLRKRSRLFFTGVALCASQAVLAEALEPITVNGHAPTANGVTAAESPVGTREDVSRESIAIQGGAEQTSHYKAIRMVPGVDVTSPDPFGMESTLRIRGKNHSNHGRTGETVEGLPIKGIGPGLGIIVDLENTQGIGVTKGPVPADEGFGFGNDVGMVDLRLRRPAERFGGTAKQALGIDDFTRTFVRMDSGRMGDVGQAFVSGSYTEADKWKGEGGSPDGRKNLAFGLTGTPEQPVDWEIFGLYNDLEKHEYRGLTYPQIQDLGDNIDFDYNDELTGDPAKDVNYYDYNREELEAWTLMGRLTAPVGDQSDITIKPYFSREEGFRLFGNGTKVIRWLIEHDTYGATAQWRREIENGEVKVGYWYGEHEPPGPPTAMKALNTGDLSFAKWARLEKATNHEFHSPFVSFDKQLGRTRVAGGLKYLRMTSPDVRIYDTQGLTDASYDDVFAQDPAVTLHLEDQTHELWLPNLGITHPLSDKLLLRASYGRNYYTPNYSFGGQVLAMQKKLSDEQLNALWLDLEPEISDNIDVGLTYTWDRGFVAPTLFVSEVENKGGNLFDPDLGLEHHQNNGEARSYGLELAAGYELTPSLTANAALTYNRYEFTEDLAGAGGTPIEAEGEQIPNVPEFMANVSADWRTLGFTVTPVVRYVGKRYSDVENEQSVSDHTLVDLTVTRQMPVGADRLLTLQASVTNLFDEQYIAIIDAPDAASPTQTGAGSVGSTRYQPGAPRAFFVTAQIDF